MINEQILTSSLTLHPKVLNGNIDNIIKEKVKSEFEGKCHDDGYIVNSSISIIKRSVGKIVTHNNQSVIKYNVIFKANILSPKEGDEIEAFVDNVNKMGVLAFIKIDSKGTDEMSDSPLIIIIPRSYFDQESTKNIDDLTKNQTINVKVVGTRSKYKSDKIQVVAKPI